MIFKSFSVSFGFVFMDNHNSDGMMGYGWGPPPCGVKVRKGDRGRIIAYYC